MAMIQIKRSPLPPKQAFLALNKDTLHTVLNTLTHSELRLYLYCAANQNNYKLPFSKQMVENDIGLSRNGFYLARDGLIKKGYITQQENGDYIFNDVNY